MLNFEGTLIASDIDMTFLDSHSHILPRNRDAIRAYCAQGGRFCFATGRTHCSLERLIPGLSELTNAPSVLANGSYLCDLASDRLYNELFLNSTDAVRMLAQQRERFPTVGFRISVGDEFYLPLMTERMQTEMHLYEGHIHIQPLCEIPLGGWNKVVFHGTPDELEPIRQSIAQWPGAGFYNVWKSSPTLLEVLDRNASKGSQLLYLKQMLSDAGTPCTVYGIGDYDNDLELLRAADIAACPSNALPCVKEICRYTLCSNDDGAIADLIEKIATERGLCFRVNTEGKERI